MRTINKIKLINGYLRVFFIGVAVVYCSVTLFPVFVPEFYALFKGVFNIDYYFEGQPLEPSDFAIIKVD